jgi:hypothetical protein
MDCLESILTHQVKEKDWTNYLASKLPEPIHLQNSFPYSDNNQLLNK